MPTPPALRRPSNPISRIVLACVVVLVGFGACTIQAAQPLFRISVDPGEISLDGATARQQIAVTGHFADQSVRDLTGMARFSIEPAGMAKVTDSGVVTPNGDDGQGFLRIEAAGKTAEIPLQVKNARRSSPVSYRRDVVAVLSKAGCNMGACHGNINGKAGFRLSIRGFDPAFDLESLTRDSLGRRISLTQPEQSLIVLKPTTRLPHEGGLRFPPGSAEEAVFLGWIGDGAKDDLATAPTLTRLTIVPDHRLIAAPGLSQQLVVTAEFSDGTRRDVTRQAAFDVSDPLLVSVTPDGLVQSQGPGEVTVAVRYLDGRGISRLAFLHDRPDFAWNDIPPANVLDTLVFDKLKSLKIHPSEPSTDAEFLRRAFLDAIGVLPSPDEARAFLADSDPEKRSKLIDRLLDRPEFADFWALKWADLLRNEEKVMGVKGVWIFQRWLRDQIEQDVPLDEFTRRIVSARGSTWRNPPSSFYRTNRDPETAAETIGQVFLGVRLQCARCHNHPFDVWTQDDYYGLAAYFANLDRKQINNVRRDRLDKHEINGDEIIYLSGKPRLKQPRSGAMLDPKPLGGPRPKLQDDPNALDDLADWLTIDNPQFARSMANRVWFHLMGRGIVDPVDDFRDSNPPSNPPLLDALTAEFVKHEMRLKPLVALIMKTRTYSFGSTPNSTNADDEANFARAAVKLVPAEVLLDAIGQALDRPEAFPNAPSSARAVQLPGVRAGGDFLKVFGKPERLLTCECERSESTTLAQAFQLINGESVRRMLEAPENRIGRLLKAGATDEAVLSNLYLATLSRPPTDPERQGALAYLARGKDRRKSWEDVAWALLNSKEFLLRH